MGVLALGVIGCSDPEPQVIDMNEVAAEAGLSEDDYVVHENGAIEVKGSEDNSTAENKVLWYQDDLSEPVDNVGMLDGKAILASAGLEPDEIEESVDHEGEPKKLYIITDETPLSAWFSHSSNGIALNWYQYSDKPKTTEYSQQSLKDAYKLARAMAGREGADAVMYLSNGGKYRSKPVGGHPATGQCNNGICFMHIDLMN
ncbi:hypothetical protein QL898_11760 [Psychrobacter sp. APC 3279]|uniref:hypothetical protein n=1 Tax=Psychrobacter sp. APC 3279 TaxID=3035189 RepID=UPI0025B488B6|nr:hypothetical protein [Psychrobacter sp. APC 3279]MDN3442310.1 hypothetical protein [Psychrobacter sp. APC 3279]